MSTVTAVTGGSLQLMHTQVTNLVLPSATIQLAKVLNDGSRRIETFRGCTALKTTIEQAQNAIPTIEVEFDALGFTTATAAVVPDLLDDVEPVRRDALHDLVRRDAHRADVDGARDRSHAGHELAVVEARA